MNKRVLACSGVAIALLVAVSCLVHAFWPGRWVPGSPLALRLPAAAHVLPGLSEIVRWRGRVHAREHGEAERWSLLGYGEGGTIFGAIDCAVTEFRRGDDSRREALPRWARRGQVGVVRLSCAAEDGTVVGEFGAFEMGCLVGGPDFDYSMAFNEEMVRLRVAAERSAPSAADASRGAGELSGDVGEDPPTFEAHPFEIRSVARPALDLDSHPAGRKYEARITGAVAEAGVNFAGRFTIVSWGCGSSCLEFAIVDLVSGEIWKPDCVALRGLDFRPDSGLLIVDSDPPTSYAPEPASYYLWSEGRLRPLSAPDDRGVSTRCAERDPKGHSGEPR